MGRVGSGLMQSQQPSNPWPTTAAVPQRPAPSMPSRPAPTRPGPSPTPGAAGGLPPPLIPRFVVKTILYRCG